MAPQLVCAKVTRSLQEAAGFRRTEGEGGPLMLADESGVGTRQVTSDAGTPSPGAGSR